MNGRVCSVTGCGEPFSSKGYCKVHAERVRRNGHPGLQTERARKPMAERLWPRVDRSGGPDACWPWTGNLSDQGYGQIRTGGLGDPQIGVHRAAWLLTYPDRESPECLDHICHDPQVCEGGPTCPHRRCCNPTHVIPTTRRENTTAGRQRSSSFRTHCKRGHEFTEANTYYHQPPGGYLARHCRACERERHRARREALELQETP